MCTSGQKRMWMGLTLAGLLCSSAVPTRLFADEKDDATAAKSDALKAKPVKVDAPAPLTERERMLMDRLEELEKRVAELEGNRSKSVSASVAAEPAAQPSAANSATPAAASTPAVTNSVEASGPQAAEKGKPGGAVAPGNASAKAEPLAFADFTWLNGNARTKETPYATSFFTPEIRADVDYVYDFPHPKDDTIGGSSEIFRSNEVHVTQLGVGGDFHYDNVRARVMTQFGLYSETTPRNDASPSRGQWNLADAYRYVSEAYGGYHFNAMHGINVDAGIFMSYMGLFSYYKFDNWAYQPSYVSSNTPWFFNGVRVQIFPTEKLKIEPWFTNGWQVLRALQQPPGIWVPDSVAAEWLAVGTRQSIMPWVKMR